MSDINDIVSLLRPSEKAGFVEFLKKRNKRKDTRNIDFFKQVLSGNSAKSKNSMTSNAYNVLKKRTTDNLINYVAGTTMSSHASDEIQVIKELLVARRLLVHEKYKIAFKLLNRAERKALEIGHFSLLNEVYHTFIEYSHLDLLSDQDVIFKKFEANQSLLLAHERMNMLYATIKKAFQESEYKGSKINVSKLLEENTQTFDLNDAHVFNFQSLQKIAEIVDIYGAHTRNYFAVDTFFESMIEVLKEGPTDNEKFLPYQIDLLYTMANIYFRKKNFDKSLSYLNDMHVQMKRYDGKYQRDRYPKFVMLKALNLHFTNRSDDAIELIDEVTNLKYKSEELLLVKLAKAMICFQKGDFKEVSKLLSKFQSTDSWYERNVGVEWLLHMKYMEIILHIELGNYDYVDSRINSMVRKYRSFFALERNEVALPFLRLIKEYYHHPKLVTSAEFRLKVEENIKWKPKEEEDVFLICFYSWLKSKMTQTDLYQTTLDIIGEG